MPSPPAAIGPCGAPRPLANPWLLGAVLASAALQLMLLYLAPLAHFFGVTPLSAIELAACGGVSLVFIAYLELEKWWSR